MNPVNESHEKEIDLEQFRFVSIFVSTILNIFILIFNILIHYG